MDNNANNPTTKLLADLGFDEKEAEIYFALLNNGAMLPQHIARKTGLKRTTLYNLFPAMINQGFIVEVQQGKRRLLSASPPDILFKEYEKHYKELKQNINELAVIYRMQGLKPNIEVFEGLEGIKKVYLDTFTQKKEILSFNRIANYHKNANDWLMKLYIPERIRRGIWLRAIVPANEAAMASLPDKAEELRKTRFVPEEKFPFKIDGMVYGDKIAFTTCEKGKPLVGIIIQSKEIAQTQRALFELAWMGAERYVEENERKVKTYFRCRAEVRKANSGDIPELNDLFCALAKFNSKHISVPEKILVGRKKDVLRAMAHEDGVIFIAHMNRRDIGYVYAYVDDDKEVKIEHLFVKRGYRGFGIGDKLVSTIMEWAGSKDIKKIVLEVFEWNKEAIDFYEDEGFAQDSILMVKKLK